MNKKFILLLSAVLVAALACGVMLGGCKKKSEPAADANQVTVTITYTAGEGADAKSGSATVKVAEGATVYDALLATGWTIDAEDAQWGKFVHGIDGITDSANTGWVYAENGNSDVDASEKQIVVDGAIYDWTLISW